MRVQVDANDACHFDGDYTMGSTSLADFASDFESLARENGTIAWAEHELMSALGYTSPKAFRKIVRRAMQACITLQIEPGVDFIFDNGKDAYKLTRFACYLVAMNSDANKPEVAMVQVYLGSFAAAMLDHRSQAEIVDRVVIREEMKEGLKSLANTASQHGVRDYARFMNAGYRGMYNRSLAEIEQLKGVGPREHLIDRMGRTELAANLFRVTLTDNKIQQDNVQGQSNLESTAHAVGKIVRDATIQAGGMRPEDLPLAEHINVAKKTLKNAGKKLKKLAAHDVDAEINYLAADSGQFEADPGYTKDPEEDSEDSFHGSESDPFESDTTAAPDAADEAPSSE